MSVRYQSLQPTYVLDLLNRLANQVLPSLDRIGINHALERVSDPPENLVR